MRTAQYGKAEFVAGQEEVEDTPTSSSSLISAPTHEALPIVDPPQSDHAAADSLADSSAEGWGEGYSILQKCFFLGVILGCIAVYLRMSNKRSDGYRKTMTRKVMPDYSEFTIWSFHPVSLHINSSLVNGKLCEAVDHTPSFKF